MNPDVIDRLRHSDPAADLQPVPPAELLERLLAEPRPAASARARSPLARRGVRIALGVTAAAALAAGASVAQLGGASPDLAARAYAQTDPDGGVLHVVLRDRSDFTGAAAPHRTSGGVESWVHGDEAHTIVTSLQDDGKTFTSDQLLGADGVIRNYLGDGELQTVSPDDGAEARQIIADSRKDFVDDFRSRYERGVLDDGGDTTFEGRPARRYVVDDARNDSRQEFFVDAETGMPLGSVDTTPTYAVKIGPDHKPVPGGPRTGTLRLTQVVELIERLPATAANLAKVRER
jgi:hypothetical protein